MAWEIEPAPPSRPPARRPDPPPQVVEVRASTKACDFCGESILLAAKKCKHCGEMLDPVLRSHEEAMRAREAQPPAAPVTIYNQVVSNSSATSTAKAQTGGSCLSTAGGCLVLILLGFLITVIASNMGPGPTPGPGVRPAPTQPAPERPNPAPAATPDPEPGPSDSASNSAPERPKDISAGRRFLTEKLAELDAFKSDSRFHERGFASGGPFEPWQSAVVSKYDAPEFSDIEKAKCHDLWFLGMEYAYAGGKENASTRRFRAEIMKVAGPGGTDGSQPGTSGDAGP